MVSSARSGPVGSVVEDRLALLSTDEFVADLDRRLATARRTVAIQLMTFDGDTSGLAVARRLIEAARRGVAVRLLVDSFALRFVSDRPVGRADVRDEFRATLAMFADLRSAGVEVRFTNPNGRYNLFALARNHKKLFVVDDAVYLGGVNVSDHNFAWHDFMVRVDDPALCGLVLDDFDATFGGRRQTVGPATGGPATSCWIVTNEAVEQTFDELVLSAERRVVIASPYALDRGLAWVLAASKASSKTVVIAARNNFRFLRFITPYFARRLARGGVELTSYTRFSHAKFLLADDCLLIGSSNFGRHSFWCNQEIGLVVRDQSFARRFEAALMTGLAPVDTSVASHEVWFGWAATAVMDAVLRIYARVVVPRVTLISSDGRRRRRAS